MPEQLGQLIASGAGCVRGRRILVSQARHVRQSAARTAPLNAVIQAAAGLDADIRALAEDGRAQRIRGMRAMAQALADRSALKPDLTPTEAADVNAGRSPTIVS